MNQDKNYSAYEGLDTFIDTYEDKKRLNIKESVLRLNTTFGIKAVTTTPTIFSIKNFTVFVCQPPLMRYDSSTMPHFKYAKNNGTQSPMVVSDLFIYDVPCVVLNYTLYTAEIQVSSWVFKEYKDKDVILTGNTSKAYINVETEKSYTLRYWAVKALTNVTYNGTLTYGMSIFKTSVCGNETVYVNNTAFSDIKMEFR